jgi:hypothetical protein
MALVLGLEVGDVVDIAEKWLAVLTVDSCRRATLITEGGKKLAINAHRMTEMVPGVWVGVGLKRATSRLRLLVEAPKHMSIKRRLS